MLVSISIGHSFLPENSFHSMRIPQFVYPLTSCWTFGLFWLTNKAAVNIMYKSLCGHLFPLPLNLWLVI